jgi:hypothetical protein
MQTNALRRGQQLKLYRMEPKKNIRANLVRLSLETKFRWTFFLLISSDTERIITYTSKQAFGL